MILLALDRSGELLVPDAIAASTEAAIAAAGNAREQVVRLDWTGPSDEFVEAVRTSRMVIACTSHLDQKAMRSGAMGKLAALCRKCYRRLYAVCVQSAITHHCDICDIALEHGDLRFRVASWCSSAWRSSYLSLDMGLFGGSTTDILPYRVIAGCDEAGRGPLAGPVYAAAVILPEGFWHPLLRDSKKMTAAERNQMRTIIEKESLSWCVESVSAAEIDEINILQASLKAMRKALFGIERKQGIAPDLILVDGTMFHPYNTLNGVPVPHKCIVKGDSKVPEISAASILAKTHRDEYMMELDRQYPQYGFSHNQGYPTEEHRLAIEKFGLTPHHRKSFSVKPLPAAESRNDVEENAPDVFAGVKQ